MIRELRIVDLGVIADASLEPGPNLTVITGETGAGKTMLLRGIDLIRGARIDTGLIRAGAKEIVVECDIEMADPQAATRVEEAGGRCEEDGSALIVRQLKESGRSRYLVGGRSVPRAVIAQVVDNELAVHGQSDQLRLRDAVTQRRTIDDFAANALLAPMNRYTDAWEERNRIDAELAEVVAHADERAREADMLRFGLELIERIDPQPGEDQHLAELANRLANVEDLRIAASGALLALQGNDLDDTGAIGRLQAAGESLARGGRDDRELDALQKRLTDLTFAIADIGSDLTRYIDSLEADPARLEQVEERRAELAKLTRTYGEDIAHVLSWAQSAVARLADVGDDGERVAVLRRRRDELTAILQDAAADLRRIRTDAAARLSKNVTAELGALSLPHAVFTISVTETEEFHRHGADEVEILFAAHHQAPLRPLSVAASGGELSRVMLAIEVAAATTGPAANLRRKKDQPPKRRTTLVFDEIDAGVGGKTATSIGRRLAQLAKFHQVIVITHLAQVAVFADTHLVVEKSENKSSVTTSVRHITKDDRVTEIARMLSGEKESDVARAHAAELLSSARVEELRE
ncbi:DNA repair protein RecN [Rarobacter incanus]|uniref:DNA repair protein RecN n=1 Tax=Rarobacter incanus TaxID=153494 RepID=A0A542SM39_9MICO|nr:DNA repair protein RecN [Rarobacter incanus]TQK75545.1 DNA replication and repair protein RecN [Rarobacter incanus]